MKIDPNLTNGKVVEYLYVELTKALFLISTFPTAPPQVRTAFDKIKSACDDLADLLKEAESGEQRSVN